jgi:hypothetical protein
MRAAWLFLVAVVGCADVSTRVNVAPSAHDGVELVAGAVERLNAAVGVERYSLRMVDHEHRVDGQVIVRGVDGPVGSDGRTAECKRTTRGVVVRLGPDATEIAVAHELGHAAGLEHHGGENNLMNAHAVGWELTAGQVDVIMGAE